VAGGRIDIEVAPDFRTFPAQFKSGLSSVGGLASSLGRGLGVAVAAGAGVAAVGLKNVIQLGNEYTANLNELQAVSGATATEMARVGQTAKALGADMTLPATSAADAANAMVELAKGGLSVDEAMKAAKGTLQLAAAAQVDGATAAELQSAALNSFGLAADQAGRVADVLANTANASASSMIDVGNSLKYVAPVSAALKVSIEDTAAAIGLLANQGIKGEQAGTSLRGILASLASPSAAAAEAMKALGIQAFDASGKFVGLRVFTDQLAQAKGRLTDAEFAAAASTAFGNEGFTAANALAAEGASAFDEMAVSVSRAGGAADVAAAQTKGLGGAWEGFKSQLETAGIEVYEVIAPGLERGVRAASDFVSRFTPTVVGGIERAIAAGQVFGPGLADAMSSRAGAVADVVSNVIEPLADGIRDTLNSAVNLGITVFGGFTDVVREGADAIQPLAEGVGDLLEGINQANGPVDALGTGLGLIYDGTAALIGILSPAVELVGDLASMFGDLPGPIQTVAVGLLALRAGPAILGGLRGALSGTAADADDAGRRTGLFSRAVGLVTAPVRLAASGVSSMTGSFRQFADEMRVQRALAAASGQSLDAVTASMGALRTTTIPSIAVLREFGDQAAAIRVGAEAVEQPVSRLGAAIGVLVERSPALAAMRDSYRSAFDTVAQASENAGLRVGVATESLMRNGVQIGSVASSVSGFGTAIRTGFSSAVDVVTSRASAMVSAVQAIPTGVGVAAISMQERLVGAANRVGAAFAALPAKIAAFPTAVGVGVIGTLERVPGAAASAVNAVGRLGAAATGAAAALGRGLATAATGLVSALGGPAGIAIAAFSLGLSFLADKQAEAKARADQHKAAVSALAEAMREAEDAGKDTANVFRDNVISQLTGQFSDAADSAAELGIGMRELVDAVSEGGEPLEAMKRRLAEIAAEDPMSDKSQKAAEVGRAIADLTTQYGDAQTANERFAAAAEGSLLTATGQGMAFAEAMGVLADKTATADDRARALKDALDALTGNQITLEAAQARINEQLDRLADNFGENLDKTKGWGAELLNASGGINTVTENGRFLFDSMQDLSVSMADVAQKAFDAAYAQDHDLTAAMEAARVAAKGVRDGFVAQGEALGLLPPQVQALADRYGLVPDEVLTLIAAPGMDSTQTELILLKHLVDQVPPGKSITVQSLSDAARQKLIDLGFTVRTLPDGDVEVIAQTGAAKAALDNYIASNNGRTITINVQSRYLNSPAGGKMFVGAEGAVVAAAYAQGGVHPRKLSPMRAGIAAVVPPNTWRVVGDRLRDDEFYIPDNDDPRSVSLGLEWARRRGLVLARKFAEGGIATNGRQDIPQSSQAGTVVNMPVTVQDNRSAYEVARVASSEIAFAARFGG
jgi:TP901 family phage tail tape measure protein